LRWRRVNGLEVRRIGQLILGGFHHEALRIVRGNNQLQSAKIDRDLFFAQPQEAPNADDDGRDAAVAVDHQIIDLSKVVSIGISSIVNRLTDDLRCKLIGIDARIARRNSDRLSR